MASASVPIPGPLGRAAGGTDPLVGDEVHLHLRLRRDDGADVAALDDDVPLAPEGPLALTHHLPHLVVAGDDRDELVDVRLADRGGDVGAVDEDAALVVEPDRVLGRERGQLGRAIERDPARRASHVSARYIAPVSR